MLRLILLSIFAITCVSSTLADVVYLRGGGSITGQVTPLMRGKQKLYIVDQGDGVRVSLAAGEVARIATENELVAEYQTRLAATPAEGEAHWQLARWCKANSLLPQYDRQVRHVIRLAPDHETARASLGYTRHEGKWVLFDQLQRSRGLVRYRGKWLPPADVAIVEAADQREVAQKTWSQQIKRLRGRALRSGKGGQEALAELQVIADPMASPAIAELLTAQKDPDTMRMLWVRLLRQWESADAADAQIFASLFDPEPAIREACLDRLEQFARPRAVNTYIALLKNNDNKKVRIAATALMAMKDPRSILPLTDALVTTHKFKSGGGPEMQTGFDRSSSGGGGFTFGGGKEKIVEKQIRNPPVLSALMTLAPGVDYGYDATAWRQYFSAQMSDVSYDLRRDL